MRLRRSVLLALVGLPVLAVALLLASAAVDQPSRYYRDAIVVEAPRERIWALLTEFEGYRDWNPYFTSASGLASEGETLELRAEPPGEDAETMSAEVLIVHPRRKLEWQTRVLVPGLLDHEQTFRVVPVGPDRFRLVQEARFEGLLAPFVDVDAQRRGLVRMLHALAERASAGYQSSSG